MIACVQQGTEAFDARVKGLVQRGADDLRRVESQVQTILDAVAQEGDVAVKRFVQQFEGRALERLTLRAEPWQAQADTVSEPIKASLTWAAERIRHYHEQQRAAQQDFHFTDTDGVALGQRSEPLAAVGVYAPGGKARYPSSVLMTAIPAQVAGVKRIVLATPNPTPEVLAAATIAGVHEILDVGGAQAIAALAYGTQSIAPVDKIVGPGNLYVAAAKRLVFGRVDIDSIAGPSEILVVADDGANPEVIAADLLAQAEHDEAAYAWLITLSHAQAKAVMQALEAQLASLPRASIARASIENHGAIFVVEDRQYACQLSTQLAPEHLSLAVADPEHWMPAIRSAGAIFMGYHTPETAGDYAAGPSHVLPTGGATRFASPLGVQDFVRRSSLINYSSVDALRRHQTHLDALATLEGLDAHARAVRVRIKDNP